MKQFLFILFILFSSLSYSQKRTNGYIGLSQSIPSLPFSKTNITYGVLFPNDNFSILVFGQYQMMGNWPIKKYYESSAHDGYKMILNLFGGGIKCQFRNASKLYHTTLKLGLLTELFSNYKGKYLGTKNPDEYGLTPVNHFNKTFNYNQEDYYYTYYYISTPLVGNLIFGNEFRLMDGLFINLGIGYSFNAFRVGFKKWNLDKTEPKSEISKPHSLINDDKSNIQMNFQHAIEISLGINYTFPFHKGKQPD